VLQADLSASTPSRVSHLQQRFLTPRHLRCFLSRVGSQIDGTDAAMSVKVTNSVCTPADGPGSIAVTRGVLEAGRNVAVRLSLCTGQSLFYKYASNALRRNNTQRDWHTHEKQDAKGELNVLGNRSVPNPLVT
jgi:hypothetical protein